MICKTVGELKAALAALPDDLLLVSEGTDAGGYDSEWKAGVQVELLTSDLVWVAGSGTFEDPPAELINEIMEVTKV